MDNISYEDGSIKTHDLPRTNIAPPLKELDDIPIEEEIRLEAREIYKKMKVKHFRTEKRKMLLFFVINEAYKTRRIPKDARGIANLVGLNPKEINRVYTTFSQSQTGYRPVLEMDTPQGLVSDLAVTVLQPESIPVLRDFSTSIVAKAPHLLQKYPRDVAIALIYYFMSINGYEVKESDFAEKYGTTVQTIKNLCDEISIARSTN